MTCVDFWRCARLLGVSVLLTACTPALNWRDVTVPEAGVALQFPCKPDAVSRQVVLSGRRVPMGLSSCAADGATFALTHAQLASPAEVQSALAAMAAAVRTNLAGQAALQASAALPGADAGLQRWRVRAQRPGGQGTLEQHVLLFSRGLQVVQVTVVADRAGDEPADTFFASLRVLR